MASLELDRRLRCASRATIYLLGAFPLAVAAVGVLVLLLAGALLAVTIVGLPLLLAGVASVHAVLRAWRRLANGALGTQLPPLPAPAVGSGGPWRRALALLGDRALWRGAATLAVETPLTFAIVAVAAIPLVLLSAFLLLGAQGLAGLGGPEYFGPWAFGPGVGVVLLLAALPAAVLTIATLDTVGTVAANAARGLLATRATGDGPVREMLAESLGDRSVAIAYWLPDREAFVDETGRPVTLPEPGSGRAWTAVERDGRPVAAIVHEASLDTSRELVHAAASAASLAIDNERLKADLRARLEELRVSRRRIVDATDEARRRIERDLHDGAQQQLVALALELRLLRARVRDDEATAALVDRLADRLADALEELRELARGIHPAILTERGLEPALAALAERAPVDVSLDVALDERLPPPVEAAAYFVVAEALTNVAKYAGAGHARVSVARAGRELLVRVGDDGVGGAAVAGGSGLRGLQDRLAAVDGTLGIDSPPGGGTRVTARIPIAAARRDRERSSEEVGA